MSIIGFLTNSNPQLLTLSRTDGVGVAPKLEIDATIRQNTSRRAMLTKNPVESGALTTDHVNLENINFEAECLVSEAPLSLLQSLIGGIAGGALGTEVGGALGSFLGTAAGASVGSQIAKFALSPDIPPSEALGSQIATRIPGDLDYPKKVYDYLLALQQDRALIKVESRMATLSDLVIVSLTAPITIENGRSMRFTVGFEQIQIIKTSTSALTESVIDAAASATGATAQNLGSQAAEEATEAAAEEPSSILSQILSVGG